MLFSLAWKNIWRNKKRSLIIILAAALGLWGSLVAGAVWMGWGESMVNTAISRNLAHLQIHKKEYLQNKEIVNFIPHGLQILKKVRTIENVHALSGRALIEGMAASPTSTFGVKIVGIIPAEAKKVTNIHDRLLAGKYFQSSGRNSIVIGKKLADRLGLKLHSKIVLSFQGLDGSLIYAAFRIAGIYKTDSSIFDQSNVFVQQTDLFRLLNSKPIIHEIAIRTETSAVLPQVFEKVKSQYPDLDVQTWNELAPEIAITSAAMESFIIFFRLSFLSHLFFALQTPMLLPSLNAFVNLECLLPSGLKREKFLPLFLLELSFF